MATTTQSSGEQPPSYTPRTAVAANTRPFTDPAWNQSDFVQILFEFQSPSPSTWTARMNVRTRDLPRLMREGFTWATDNIHREAGRMKRGPVRSCFSERGWKHCRIFYLSSLEKEGDDKGDGADGMHFWAAELDVYAKDTADLARFRPEVDIIPERISFAEAYDGKSRAGTYYTYRKGRPIECYNVIYGDMPLPGAWPWPKEDEPRKGDADKKDSVSIAARAGTKKADKKKDCIVM